MGSANRHRAAAYSAEILVIDPDRASGESLRMILTPRHRVAVATDLRDALALAAALRVDVVTLEPDPNGARVGADLATIRKAFPTSEIVVVTRSRSLETAREGIRQGVFDYLFKPFDVAELRDSVNRALLQRAERARLQHPLGAPADPIVGAPHSTGAMGGHRPHWHSARPGAQR